MLEVVFGIFDLLLVASYVLWDVFKIYETKEIAFQNFVVLQFSLLVTYLLARIRLTEKHISGSYLETGEGYRP